MTTWTIPAALMAALILFASLTTASADNSTATNDTRPDDAAWVEDCPPEMMCAMDQPVNSTDGDNAWVEDCPEGMVCAYDDDGREPDTAGNDTEADPIRGDAEGDGNMVPGIGVFAVLGLSAVMAVVGALAGPEDKRRRR